MNSRTAWAAYWIPSLIMGVFTIGVLAMVAVSVRREDRRFSRYGTAPGRRRRRPGG